MIVRCRLFYSIRGVEVSNYRWLLATPDPPPELRQAFTDLALLHWVQSWRGQNATDVEYQHGTTEWFDDSINPVGLSQEWRLPAPLEGFMPFIGSLKPELCVGIVTQSGIGVRRMYRAGVPTDFANTIGELDAAAPLIFNSGEAAFHLSFTQVHVSLVDHTWATVITYGCQHELMTHNHRKVHVPFGEGGQLAG